MTRPVAIRAAAALAGILVFVIGVHADSTATRWAGIALLGAAFVLRFVDRSKPG